MQQIGTESQAPQKSPSASGRAGLWISVIGIAALVVIFVVALLQAADTNSLLGWVLAGIALGWLLLAVFVLWSVRKAARYGARQMEQAQENAQRAFGRAPAAAASSAAPDRSITDQKIEHSFQIIMVQTRVIAASLPAADGSSEGDRAQVDRALDTIAVTASNGMGIVQDSSAPVDGDIVD
ncbi:hypothetical protein [Kocuria palustris]|uniref:hypothetical protein n=1 Tax=Kocuria palustris TaxID=71999 RepID=UPI0011AAC1B5|nr:hypothetical protein [Kocuria palustris]